MPFLSLDSITKRYAGTKAVDDLSLDVEEGECLVLLGPSGCGKTTTLNIIAGFLTPDQGTIRLAGVDITRSPPTPPRHGHGVPGLRAVPAHDPRRQRGFWAQDARCGQQGAPGQRRGRPGHRGPRCPIGPLPRPAQRRPAPARGPRPRPRPSGPRLLLFDEPLSNLDAQLRDQLRTEIRTVLTTAGITAIFVTHDQSEALALADQVALLNNGRLEQRASPAEIYTKPATRFAATFLGNCNLIEGPPTLAIRPHHLRIDPAGGLDATITTVEYLGATTRLTLHSRAGPLTAELPNPAPVLIPGHPIRLAWNPEDAWLIPAGP